MQMLATGDMQMIQLVNTLPSAKTTRSDPYSQLSTSPNHTAHREPSPIPATTHGYANEHTT